MAIRTKKISELNNIPLEVKDGETTLDKNEFYFLGCYDSITGKVSTKEIADSIRSIATKLIEEKVDKDSLTNTPSISEDVINDLKESSALTSSSVVTLDTKLNEIDAKYKKLAHDVTLKYEELQETIVTLSDKVAKLEAFVHSLQSEGYLTLANIKKLAAEHCPCEEETHNGEQVEPTE